MAILRRARRLAAALLAIACIVATAPAARAADPYEINVILSLTGYVAFVGQTQLQSLKAMEAYVNKNGGIAGRPVSFVVADDQSNPQVTVALAQALIAKHVPIILGPTGPDTCGAITPLAAQNGPLLYCVTPAGNPPAGSYVFQTLFTAEAQLGVVLRFFRERGFHRLAYIVSTDAAGQDAERALLAAAAAPENKALQIVARQHFGVTDLSVTAQAAQIKAANPDVLIAWSAGTAAGTLFHGLQDAGLDLPTLTSAANLNPGFFKQYGALIPKSLYFAGIPYYGTDQSSATKAAIANMTAALAALNAKPDQIAISSWDPGMLLIDALRKLGPDASPAKLRAYLAGLKGWVGVNGPYDFPALPQRGLGENNVVIIKWDPASNAAVAVSRMGGAPLPGK
jgi:branched-chain amino acid transport system substrate-binding protein